MKKAIYLLIIVCISEFASAQGTNFEMKFRYQHRDTVLNQQKIYLWNNAGTFPAYIGWKNTPFAIQHSTIGGIGLFTDSTHSFSTGQDIGYVYIKAASTGSFMNDYYESNIGIFTNDAEAKNVEIVLMTDGLIMRALTNISPNTEIIASSSDILTLFPNDKNLIFLFHK